MQYDTILVETFGSSPIIRIIDFLLDNSLFDYSKEEIIQETRMSKTTFYKYFDIIEKNGLVRITRKVGKSKMYRLNEKSDAIKKLKELVWVLGIDAMNRVIGDYNRQRIRKPLIS